MNEHLRTVKALALSSFLILSACSNVSPAKAPAAPKQAQEEQVLAGGTSNELTGTWVSPCFAFINNQFASATYIFQGDGKIDILNQVYFDDDCRTLDSTEQLNGEVSYGISVTTPTGAKKIDIKVGGRGIVRSIYSVKDDSLCFGSQSSPLIDGRPSEIKCSKVFKRL